MGWRRDWAMLALTAAALSACVTAWYLQFDDLNIVSNPPGARIELNNEYVGRTPLTIRHRRGGVHGQANRLTIRALHPSLPDCAESRVIGPGDRTPGLVYFELSPCAARPG